MKKLSKETQIDLGIEENFASRLYAYTPTIAEHGIGLGIACANESGYTPVPFSRCHADTWDEMQAHAGELNAELDLDVMQAERIIASSMAAQNRALAGLKKLDGEKPANELH